MTDPELPQQPDANRVHSGTYLSQSAPSSAEEPDTAEAQEPLDPAAVAEAQRDEYLDALQRERAEFENFRKRSARERADAQDRGAEQMAAALLSVLDNFGLALEAAAGSSDDQLAKGVRLVYEQMVATLEQFGLTEVEGVGADFDPTIHEALLQVDAVEVLGREVEEPHVVEVLRPGYRFKGRVLRAASVKVAR